jgi:hypothetical protein
MNKSKTAAYKLLSGSTAGLITISFVWYLFRTSFAWEAIVGAIAWIIFYVTTIHGKNIQADGERKPTTLAETPLEKHS